MGEPTRFSGSMKIHAEKPQGIQVQEGDTQKH